MDPKDYIEIFKEPSRTSSSSSYWHLESGFSIIFPEIPSEILKTRVPFFQKLNTQNLTLAYKLWKETKDIYRKTLSEALKTKSHEEAAKIARVKEQEAIIQKLARLRVTYVKEIQNIFRYYHYFIDW